MPGSVLENEKIDYFIFGHRHLAMTYKLKEESEIIFLGDWIKNGVMLNGMGIILSFKISDLISSVFNLNCQSIIGIQIIYLFKLVYQFTP